MGKDFDSWNTLKKNLHANEQFAHVHEREVWFCALGVNIGFEQDGSGKEFLRPVVILKKFNNSIFLGIPLTKTNKSSKFYFPFSFIQGQQSVAILSQIRLLDAKRLRYKRGVMEQSEFFEMKKHLIDLLK
jgi:mRNA interferase MazF